jgi:ABC-type Fe3+/spermidine/putrescine transport system ATPase subunit
MIALEDLSVTIGAFWLNRISLHAGDGEYFVLLGPSGAGKTVLLEVIAGLRAPDSGKVTVNLKDMAGVKPEHRGIALVYQDYSLFPHLTVAENIAYGMQVRSRPDHEIRKRVDDLLADFGILHLGQRYPGSLSGGEQQRVAIARALATNPSVLLLDEPFASLDPRACDECIRVMQDVKDTRSVTIIQVSHSHEEAYALADRVGVLLGGRIKQTGTPDEIFRNPSSEAVARFVGMDNVLSGSVTNSSGCSRMTTGTVSIPLPGSYPEGTVVTIGIPADCIRVFPGPPEFDQPGSTSVPCKVRRVTLSRDCITFHLDGAAPLVSVMQRTGSTGIVPERGSPVYAVFRDTDIRVLLGD